MNSWAVQAMRLAFADAPSGGLTVIAFANNHLQYALTWFVLALMLAGGAWLVFRHERHPGASRCATPKRENRMRKSEFHVTKLLFAALTCFSFHQHASAADPGQYLIPQLQERYGLSEAQARGSLGALLIFVRERLPRPEFDRLSKGIPNAAYIMREVRMRGVVTRPIHDIEDYEASLASLGIGQPLASQIAPAVLEYLGARGFERERSALARVLD